MNAQLAEWDAKVKILQAKYDKASADTAIEYEKKLEEKKKKRAEAESKLAELENAGCEAWQELKEGAENAWQSLADAVKSASEKFWPQAFGLNQGLPRLPDRSAYFWWGAPDPVACCGVVCEADRFAAG